MFTDRKDAGIRLGRALEAYERCDGLVLGIPRGGVEVGYYVAEHLEVPLSMVVVRKLPLPENPEAGFGAIAEDGSTYFIDRIAEALPSEVAGPSAARRLAETVDEIVILEKPMFFHAVAQAYENWRDVPDAEVVNIMQRSGQLPLGSKRGS